MNPNAPAFEFNPDASSFEPPQTPNEKNNVEETMETNTAKTMSLSLGGPARTISLSTEEPPKSDAGDNVVETEEQPLNKPSTLTPAAVVATKSATSKPTSTVASSSNTPLATPPIQAQGNQNLVLEQVAAQDKEIIEDLYGDGSDYMGKEHLNIVFIGHVDAGKSTMGGHLLYLTGRIDQRTMEKLHKDAKDAGRETWYLSWALDSTSQERSQGKTVEVGRAWFETEKRKYTVLDAPGHKTYVPSMFGGAAQADVALLVVSSRRGEYETGFERGGQTREHAQLVKAAGVQKLIVVINKMDDPTVEWSQARYEEIQSKLTPFLKSNQFNPKTDFVYIPVSGYSGDNLKDRVSKDKAPWYDGPSLLEYLDELKLEDRQINAPLIMPVAAKYNEMGTKVEGKIERGQIRKGQQLLLMPNRTPVEVLQIQDEGEEDIEHAICGDQIKVRLKGINDEDVMPGFVLSDRRSPVNAVRRFEAQLAILDHKNIITAGYSAIIHAHTLTEEISLVALLHYYDKKTNRRSKRAPQFAKKGQRVLAMLEVQAPICLEKFEDLAHMGRFTLRDEGSTVAIGKVTRLIQTDEDVSERAKLTIAAGAAAGDSVQN